MKVNPSNFYQYAYSDFLDNRNRGALAEYIVAQACGVKEPPYLSWESYDLETPEGIKVEVKTSAYLQTWYQKALSKPSFGIAKKFGWVGETNEFDNIKARQADVYVFCLFKEKDEKIADPLNLEQWEFYIVSTKLLNEKFPEQKTISLNVLKGITEVIKYSEIKQKIPTNPIRGQQGL